MQPAPPASMTTSPGPLRSLAFLEERLATTTDPRQRANLALFARRVAGEMTGDLDTVVKSVAPDFRFVTHPRTPGATIDSADALATSLAGMRAAGVRLLWVDWEQLSVDEWGVAFNGVVQTVVLGRLLPDAGDPDAAYLVSARMGAFIAIRDGLMQHETAYTHPAGREPEPLDPSTLPSEDSLRTLAVRFAV